MKKKILLLIIIILIIIPKTSFAAGKGSITGLKIDYNVGDSEGRCGDKCASISTVTYEKGKVTYYLGVKDNTIEDKTGSIEVLTSLINAIKDTKYSPKEVAEYLKVLPPTYKSVLRSINISNVLNHYGIKAQTYFGNLKRSDAADNIKKAIDNGQPAMILVSHSLCSDLAKTNEAYLVLGIDDDGYVKMVSPSNKTISPRTKKRTPEELSKCLSNSITSTLSFRMLVFDFKNDKNSTTDQEETEETSKPFNQTTGNENDEEIKCGTTDETIYCFPPIASNDNFTCANVFYFKNSAGEAERTEFKKTLDTIFLILEISAPVIAIALITIDYIKILPSKDSLRKTNIRSVKRIVITIAILFLPYLLDLTFRMYGLFDLNRCNVGNGANDMSQIKLKKENITSTSDGTNWTTTNGVCIEGVIKNNHNSCNTYSGNLSTLQYPIAETALMMAHPNSEKATGNYGTELYVNMYDAVYKNESAYKDDYLYRTGQRQEASNGNTRYKSCSEAAGVAIRSSGADDNFPPGGADAQYSYALNHSNIWQQVNWSDVKELQPGDVFIDPSESNPQTFIYVGTELLHKYFSDAPANYNAVEANYNTDYINKARSPYITNRSDLDSSRWTVFRNIKKEANSKYANIKNNG